MTDSNHNHCSDERECVELLRAEGYAISDSQCCVCFFSANSDLFDRLDYGTKAMLTILKDD